MVSCSHLLALLKKNYLLWRRSLFCILLELAMPVGFVSILFSIRSIPKIHKEEQSFVNRQDYFYNIPTQNQSQYYIKPEIEEDKGPFWFDIYNPDFENKYGLGRNIGGINYQPPYIKECNSDDHIKYIAMAPKNNEFLSELEDYLQPMNWQYKYFDDVQEIQKYVKNEDYEGDICMGIIMDKNSNDGYSYKLMFNNTLESELPDTKDEKLPYLIKVFGQNYDKYRNSGFIQLQLWIDNLILKKTTNDSDQSISLFASQIRSVPHFRDMYTETAEIYLPQMFTMMGMVVIFLRTVQYILNEKETKIRETMKIMGMSDFSYYLSMFIPYAIIYAIMSSYMAAIFQASQFNTAGYGIIYVWFFLYCLCLFMQSFIFTTFFSYAKTANIMSLVFYLILIFQVDMVETKYISDSSKFWYALLPQGAFKIGLHAFIQSEITEDGMQWSNYETKYQNCSLQFSIVMMIVDFIIYAIIGIYLDQVFPNDYGAKRHPLLCLRKLWKNSSNINLIESSKKAQNPPIIEPISVNLQQMEDNKQMLKTQDLHKIYSNNKHAVKGLNLTFYQDQISILLGHNGAGKTSTLNMLTGMQNPTAGQGSVLGKDIVLEINKIRKMTGYCPQVNTIYPFLTVRQHLNLYAAFKGIGIFKRKEEINQILKDIELEEKQHQFASELSGGQKRRLCIGIAFIGGSKIVYLDEPTSGMDTQSRRSIWEMLKKYKAGRIIILTTHFMDEADFLGDRVNIMSDGVLQCAGSPIFLKKQFGTGYNLVCQKIDAKKNSDKLIKAVFNHIPETQIISNVSAEISFQLSMKEVSKFKGLFDYMDQNSEQLNLQNYGVSITSLEEVFLNLSLEEQRVKNKQNKENNNDEKKEDIKLEIQAQNSQITQIYFDTFFIIKFIRQLWALLQKRVYSFIRDPKYLFQEIIIPLLIIIFAFAILVNNTLEEQSPLKLNLAYFDDIGISPTIVSGPQQQSIEQLQKYIKFDTQYSSSGDNQTIFDQYVFDHRQDGQRAAVFFNELSPSQISNQQYYLQVNTTVKDGFPIFVNSLNQGIIQKQLQNDQFTLDIEFVPFANTAISQQMKFLNNGFLCTMIVGICFAFFSSSVLQFMTREREINSKHQQMVQGTYILSYWLSNFIFDYFKYCVLSSGLIALVAIFDLEYFIQGGAFSTFNNLIFFYGLCIIPMCYVFTFLFRDSGNAQVNSFFICGLLALFLVMPSFVMVMTSPEAQPYYANSMRWFAPFTLQNGLLMLSARKAISIFTGNEEMHPDDFNCAGGDVLFLQLGCLFWIFILFLIEFWNKFTMIFYSCMYREDKALKNIKDFQGFEDGYIDEDVINEENEVKKSHPSDHYIRVNNLVKTYKKVQAVKGVSFQIEKGECFTLLGANGAGKTTTFKMLTGDILPTNGSAHIVGNNIVTQTQQVRKHIGYCPQFDSLFDLMTAKEHLVFYSRLRGIKESQINEIVQEKIQQMGLRDFENVAAGTYSGGNKRKLSVAIATLGNPDVIFLDEPSTGMDPFARRFMWNVISNISSQTRQCSIILTTHSMEEAEALSNKLAIQVQGKIKCIGSLQHIKGKYGDGYEIEIKQNYPDINQIQQRFMKSNIGGELNDQIGMNKNLEFLCKQLSKLGDKMYSEIGLDKTGSALFMLQKNNELTLRHLIEFILVEEQGIDMQNELSKKLGQIQIVEHFQSFYRLKVQRNISLGNLFKQLEQNKNIFNIAQYSIKQTSLEQIFNNFAQDKIQYQPPPLQQQNQQQQVEVEIPNYKNDVMINEKQNSEKEVVIYSQQQQQEEDSPSQKSSQSQLPIRINTEQVRFNNQNNHQ